MHRARTRVLVAPEWSVHSDTNASSNKVELTLKERLSQLVSAHADEHRNTTSDPASGILSCIQHDPQPPGAPGLAAGSPPPEPATSSTLPTHLALPPPPVPPYAAVRSAWPEPALLDMVKQQALYPSDINLRLPAPSRNSVDGEPSVLPATLSGGSMLQAISDEAQASITATPSSASHQFVQQLADLCARAAADRPSLLQDVSMLAAARPRPLGDGTAPGPPMQGDAPAQPPLAPAVALAAAAHGVAPAPAMEAAALGAPAALAGFQGDLLALQPCALPYWDKLSLEPCGPRKAAEFYVLCPGHHASAARMFVKDVSATFLAMRLGTHSAARTPSHLHSLDGVVPVPEEPGADGADCSSSGAALATAGRRPDRSALRSAVLGFRCNTGPASVAGEAGWDPDLPGFRPRRQRPSRAERLQSLQHQMQSQEEPRQQQPSQPGPHQHYWRNLRHVSRQLQRHLLMHPPRPPPPAQHSPQSPPRSAATRPHSPHPPRPGASGVDAGGAGTRGSGGVSNSGGTGGGGDCDLLGLGPPALVVYVVPPSDSPADATRAMLEVAACLAPLTAAARCAPALVPLVEARTRSAACRADAMGAGRDEPGAVAQQAAEPARDVVAGAATVGGSGPGIPASGVGYGRGGVAAGNGGERICGRSASATPTLPTPPGGFSPGLSVDCGGGRVPATADSASSSGGDGGAAAVAAPAAVVDAGDPALLARLGGAARHLYQATTCSSAAPSAAAGSSSSSSVVAPAALDAGLAEHGLPACPQLDLPSLPTTELTLQLVLPSSLADITGACVRATACAAYSKLCRRQAPYGAAAAASACGASSGPAAPAAASLSSTGLAAALGERSTYCSAASEGRCSGLRNGAQLESTGDGVLAACSGRATLHEPLVALAPPPEALGLAAEAEAGPLHAAQPVMAAGGGGNCAASQALMPPTLHCCYAWRRCGSGLPLHPIRRASAGSPRAPQRCWLAMAFCDGDGHLLDTRALSLHVPNPPDSRETDGAGAAAATASVATDCGGGTCSPGHLATEEPCGCRRAGGGMLPCHGTCRQPANGAGTSGPSDGTTARARAHSTSALPEAAAHAPVAPPSQAAAPALSLDALVCRAVLGHARLLRQQLAASTAQGSSGSPAPLLGALGLGAAGTPGRGPAMSLAVCKLGPPTVMEAAEWRTLLAPGPCNSTARAACVEAEVDADVDGGSGDDKAAEAEAVTLSWLEPHPSVATHPGCRLPQGGFALAHTPGPQAPLSQASRGAAADVAEAGHGQGPVTLVSFPSQPPPSAACAAAAALQRHLRMLSVHPWPHTPAGEVTGSDGTQSRRSGALRRKRSNASLSPPHSGLDGGGGDGFGDGSEGGTGAAANGPAGTEHGRAHKRRRWGCAANGDGALSAPSPLATGLAEATPALTPAFLRQLHGLCLLRDWTLAAQSGPRGGLPSALGGRRRGDGSSSADDDAASLLPLHAAVCGRLLRLLDECDSLASLSV